MKEITNKKKIIIVATSIVSLIVVVSGIFGWVHYREHQKEVLAQMKSYNDSIENVQQELIRLEQLRNDSIAREEELRFSVDALISEIKFYGDERGFGQSIREDWEQNIKKLGFEKQPKELEYYNASEYNDELYDGYSIPYIRILNGRTITVKPMYVTYKREQDGTWIPEKDRGLFFDSHFKVSFSHTEDYDYFEKSIREMGLTKHQSLPDQFNDFTSGTYYRSDPDKYKGELKSNHKDRSICPNVRIDVDSLSLKIYDYTDC